ncbi:MAG TPA: general stress protein [Phototrophicaceae bacterium]|jgi:uncharacterized membrane protein|nr:general stress protein [Phototrophicaceae bacterium]
MTSTILATFDNQESANAAVRDLKEAGFDSSDIGVAVYDTEQAVYLDDLDGAEGTGVGALAGSIFGAVVGLATITVPGIGPIIAAGPLAAAIGALAGAGVGALSGAATGGIVASLVNLGVPESDAHSYAESLRRGAVLVSVNVYEVDAERAVHILQNHHPFDIDRRVAEWRNEGWSGFDPKAEPYAREEHPEVEYDLDDDDEYEDDDFTEKNKNGDTTTRIHQYPNP